MMCLTGSHPPVPPPPPPSRVQAFLDMRQVMGILGKILAQCRALCSLVQVCPRRPSPPGLRLCGQPLAAERQLDGLGCFCFALLFAALTSCPPALLWLPVPVCSAWPTAQ